MSSLATYLHTLRYLRPVQVFGRVRFKLWKPRPEEAAAPPLRTSAAEFAAPIYVPHSLLGPDRFRFLNLEGTCSEAAHWQRQAQSQLWMYNLHYFDDLNSADASARLPWHELLVRRWIDENPPGVGIGWDPYPVSRRIVNWIKWSRAGNSLTPKAQHSLAVQARWLNRRIESHLQGNHVFVNAKALIFAGLFFDGEEADRWLSHGLGLMQNEIPKQVLADGGHFERSPMYHAGFAEDMLDVVNIMKAYGRQFDANWRETIARMLVWLDAMSHPDKGIAFFNDAAFGVSPDTAQLHAYAARLKMGFVPPESSGTHRLTSSGYVSVDLPPFYLVCDVAPIGPDHLPAHAHADTLSFEMSFRGQRVLVNSGTSEYGLSAERQRQRGTAAHNTLVLDDEDSSEVWAAFRVARRARARLLEVHGENSEVSIMGEHDGYRRLRGKNIHRRCWKLQAQELVIEDEVDGTFRSAKCFFHLHPAVHLQRAGDSELQLSDSRGLLLKMHFEGAAQVQITDSTWHPEFGVAVANCCIVVKLSGSRLATRIHASGSF